MCGICGAVGRVQSGIIQQMTDAMIHRGPDSAGYYTDERIQMGMRRLKIIDLEGSEQPLTNEDGTIHLVCNGEIYNYQSLRRQLEDRGHRFKTQGDVEVIIHLYEEYGLECPGHLDGMFAFAIWDTNRYQLLLARDRLGVKPLYYSRMPNCLLFASEIRSILASGEVPKELNEVSVTQFLAFPAVPAPYSIINQIQMLHPGHLLTFSAERLEIREYWDVDFTRGEANLLTSEDSIDAVREALTDSVKKRLMSDVPLGAFLSGGIDSSAVVAIMGKLLNRAVKTFSIRFTGKSRSYDWFDDASFAVEVAREFGTEHTELTVTGEDVVRHLLRAVWAMDQPSGDALQYYIVSECASREVTVALSGTGGDEVFGGYEWFKEIRKIEKFHQMTGFLKPGMAIYLEKILNRIGRNHELGPLRSRIRFILAGKKGFAHRYLLNRRLYYNEDFNYLFSPEFLSQIAGYKSVQEPKIEQFSRRTEGLDPINRMSYMQLKSDMSNLLVRDQDAVSMAHSLEVRLPMIDSNLVETAARVPPEMKLRGNQEKYVLRQAVKDILPEVITSRRKKGFIFPMDDWMRNELNPVVESCLSPASVKRRGIFSEPAVTALKTAFYQGKQPFFKIWNLAVFELWCRLVMDRDDGWKEPSGDLKEYLHD